MYPDIESHLPSKGNSPDHQSPGGCGTQTPAADADEERRRSGEDATSRLPNTTNSSTMTCPEWQCPGGWPPPLPQYTFPYPYAPPYGGGMLCYPPYFVNPGAYGCPYHGGVVPLRPPYCNNVGVSPSGMSVAHQAASNAAGNSEHMLATNQNCYHPVGCPYPPFYNPNHHVLLQSQAGLPVVLTPGRTVPASQGPDGARSRNSLCSNCSTEIIPTVDEEEMWRAPLNITSFTDSTGRVWKCAGRKSATPRRRDALADARRSGVASRAAESPATSRDDPVLPLRKKRTKLRSRRTPEEASVCTPTGRPQSKPRVVLGPAKKVGHVCGLTDAGLPGPVTTDARSKPVRKAPPSPKEEPKDAKACKRGEGQEAATFHDAGPKKPHVAAAEGAEDERAALDERRGEQDVCGPSPDEGAKQPHVATETPGTKYVAAVTTEEKASCNDFVKRNGPRSDAQRPQDPKEEDFWSSSSSSGTYDDNEAFDSFKLLNEAGVGTEAMRQSRQRSRDRLFRRRLGGGAAKLSNAQSEEALKKRRRSASPRAKGSDERPKEQVLVDTSQVRITEETPKRFVVESKDGASTSQKAMTITVQAEVPTRGGECVFCAEGGHGSADSGCTCELPPCQRPQWQAPPCPANEIHGTPVHHCHNAPPARPPPPQVHYQRQQRRANSPPHAGELLLPHEMEEYRRSPRRANLPNFGLVTPWNQRNVDRPREENRHPHYIPPRPSTERLDDPRREHGVPTNRTRRWHTQAEPLGAAETRSNRQAEEMLRIQIPNSFPRYRPYEYARNHNEDVADAREVAEDNVEGRPNRNTIDINIFRSGGVRRLGTVRRVVQCNSPRSRGVEASPARPPPEEDPDSNLDFYRRPRSAITVSKTNYFSPRNRKLEEEVQRIQSANYGLDGGADDQSASGGAKGGEEEEGPEYPGAKDRDDEREFEDGEKPDCDYEEETDDSKRDQDLHCDVEDEED